MVSFNPVKPLKSVRTITLSSMLSSLKEQQERASNLELFATLPNILIWKIDCS